MVQSVNQSRLFLGSCFALITTAFSFSIRAGILAQLGNQFQLTGEQLGWMSSMWFFGFPIAMIIGGLVYYSVGPKKIMLFAFVAHAVGILMTIFATGYSTLLISSLLIGLGNGCTEAACNPMIADTYSGANMNKMLNRFHMWFPGGIVVGSLISEFMTKAGMSWEAQIGIILIPAITYFILFWGQQFPQPKVEGADSISNNLKAMVSPLFIFIFCCMALTAISEFGPQQWTGLIMSKSGASPMLILALVTGTMAVCRYFAGSIYAVLGQTGVLLVSSVLATAGILLFATQTGTMTYVAALCFAFGVALFWPTMLGFVAEKMPKTGAFGLSIVGGIGMFSTAIFQPIIGGWLDSEKATAATKGLTGDLAELTAGQATLDNIAIFPAILIVAFAGLFMYMRKRPAMATA